MIQYPIKMDRILRREQLNNLLSQLQSSESSIVMQIIDVQTELEIIDKLDKLFKDEDGK